MSTKLKRLTIVCPAHLQKLIEDDANLNMRSVSSVVVYRLTRMYAEEERQASLFTPQQLGDERRKVPTFGTPVPLDSEQSSKPRASLATDKS